MSVLNSQPEMCGFCCQQGNFLNLLFVTSDLSRDVPVGDHGEAGKAV